MTRVGVTGHQELTPLAKAPRHGDPPPWAWVEEKMRRELAEISPPLVGVSPLAKGADQLFARLVLEREGKLEIIIPFDGYRELLPDEARDAFDSFWKRDPHPANLNPTLYQPPRPRRDELFFEAGRKVVEVSDEMFFVLERGRGGVAGTTHNVLDYARERARPHTIFDPRTREVLRSPGHPRGLVHSVDRR